MQVILFRHGPAGDPDPSRWPTDVDRPLTPKGIERTRASGRGLARLVGEVTCVVTSPYERALGTANILADVFGESDKSPLAQRFKNKKLVGEPPTQPHLVE